MSMSGNQEIIPDHMLCLFVSVLIYYTILVTITLSKKEKSSFILGNGMLIGNAWGVGLEPPLFP